MPATVTYNFFRSALLGALLIPASALAAPAAPQPVAACAATGTASAVASHAAGTTPARPAPANDIDYAVINQHLTQPDARQRMRGLQADVRQLAQARAPEAGLVRQRLLFALAQTQAGLGRHEAARASLRQLPVSSPQAPEALLLMAELAAADGDAAAAVRWLRQLAELFPEEAASVQGLWRAAELSEADAPRALALWRQAAQLADQGLASAQRWQEQSLLPGFIDTATGERLSPALWRLARATLGSATFASADAAQVEARRQLHCLSANQEAQLRRLERNPRLLADLGSTVDTLDTQLQTAREDLTAREAAFQATARRHQDCRASHGECADLKSAHDTQGRELTGWRNRVRTLEGKLAFLRREEERLRAAPAAASVSTTTVARQLGNRLGDSRGFMQQQLRQSLADAVQEWEALSAEAHYRLALAQEAQIQPGARPAD